MHRPRIRWMVALLLALGSQVSVAEGDLDVVRAAEGYRIIRPSAAWSVREVPPPPTVWHALKLELAPAPSEVSVTVFVADAPPEATAERLRDLAVGRWKRHAVGPVGADTTLVGGVAAPSLTFDAGAAGNLVRMRHVYLLHGDDAALLRCQAPAAVFAAHEAAFAAALASFAFVPANEAGLESRRLRRLAARCGSDVPRARSWTEAASRAARERRLVFVVFEMYRGLPIPPLADSTTFMDEDLVHLLRERFVVLPWSDDAGAPIAKPEVYGLGRHTFGQGVVFATSAGRVVGSLGMIEPSLVEEAARRALAAVPEASGPVPDAEDAAAALRRGELDRASVLLATPSDASQWMLRARLRRRLHDADGALAALEQAATLGAEPGAVATERGLVLLRAGRNEEAQASFRLAGERPAARFWQAVARATREGLVPLREEFLAISRGDPEDRYTWRAAAILLGRGLASGAEAVHWPAKEVREAAAPRPPAPPAEADLDRVQAEAISYLIRTQRADGTWPVPMSFAPNTTRPLPVAVTAIVAAALDRHRDHPEAAAAVTRAVEAVVGARSSLAAERPGVFDYGVWARIYALRLLVARMGAETSEGAAPLAGAAREIVEALARTRAAGGGWSYARLEDAAGTPVDNSISFVVAPALLALLEAREAGIAVPADVLRSAGDVLASMRRGNETWRYQTATPGMEDASEAALRGPLCALALRRAGRTEGVADLERSTAILTEHLAACFRQAGKSLCHTAPDAVSAYYLLFGCRYAAEALRELPEASRATARRAILEQVLALRREDGSFVDFPPVGPAYGTAMALEILDLLR